MDMDSNVAYSMTPLNINIRAMRARGTLEQRDEDLYTQIPKST